MEKVHLGQTARIRDGLALGLDIHQHFGYSVAGKSEINQGEVDQEKVHRSVEVESEVIARMINKFPTTVIIYMQRNRERGAYHVLAFLKVPGG
jgi:hypothetical protein